MATELAMSPRRLHIDMRIYSHQFREKWQRLFSVKAAEASAEGASIYMLDKNCKVAKAYGKIVEEILSYE